MNVSVDIWLKPFLLKCAWDYLSGTPFSGGPGAFFGETGSLACISFWISSRVLTSGLPLGFPKDSVVFCPHTHAQCAARGFLLQCFQFNHIQLDHCGRVPSALTSYRRKLDLLVLVEGFLLSAVTIPEHV